MNDKKVVLFIVAFLSIASPAFSHSGRLDGNGGHRVNKTWKFERGRYLVVKNGIKYLQYGEVQFNPGDYHYHVKPGVNGFKDGIYLPAEDIGGTKTDNVAITEQTVVGSKESDVYHKPDCSYTRRIKEENAVIFNDSEESEKNEYVPCKRCFPESKDE